MIEGAWGELPCFSLSPPSHCFPGRKVQSQKVPVKVMRKLKPGLSMFKRKKLERGIPSAAYGVPSSYLRYTSMELILKNTLKAL